MPDIAGPFLSAGLQVLASSMALLVPSRPCQGYILLEGFSCCGWWENGPTGSWYPRTEAYLIHTDNAKISAHDIQHDLTQSLQLQAVCHRSVLLQNTEYKCHSSLVCPHLQRTLQGVSAMPDWGTLLQELQKD